MSKRTNLYAATTAAIIAQLEAGTRPWVKPWKDGSALRPLRHSGEPYRGINVILLWMAADAAGFASSTWMTYRQARALGGQVRGGQKGTGVIFAKPTIYDAEADPETGEMTTRQGSVLRAYTVFNCDQIDDLPSRFQPAGEARSGPSTLPAAEAFFLTCAPKTAERPQAFYSPTGDYIGLPERATFDSDESWAATFAHELIHWTGAPSRLDRPGGKAASDAYAREELVAEIGAAFLCADLGISPSVREDHASYLAHWLQILRTDTRAIFTAASAAQTAVDYLHGLQPAAEAAA